MTEEQRGWLETLDEVHIDLIRRHKKRVSKKIVITFLPFATGTMLLLFSSFYLVPSGLLSEWHHYGEWEPVTMVEVWLMFYMGQFLTAFTAIRFMQEYAWTVKTIPVYDGDRTRETTAIAVLDTGLGGRLYLGKRLHERYHAPPTTYHNREGITFSSLDQAELLNIVRYIQQQDHLNQHAYKSGTAKYQKLQVNMQGGEQE
ncbi:MAG: hypothetical protein QCI38_09035 [Candidatus Thermoplasmatota archaeon]|nr:hypothetical protein [Candidatus Thermoplasmatota archaeon]